MSKKSKRQVYWAGTQDTCDICENPLRNHMIDGATSRGWACMCTHCHMYYGRGLGTGRGQKYARQTDGRWLKVEG